MFTVHLTGTEECISQHSTLLAALASAVGSWTALGGERTIRGDIPEQVVDRGADYLCGKVHEDGAVMINPTAARFLWL